MSELSKSLTDTQRKLSQQPIAVRTDDSQKEFLISGKKRGIVGTLVGSAGGFSRMDTFRSYKILDSHTTT